MATQGLNRLQIKIFHTLSKQKELDIDTYVCKYSEQYLCKQAESLEDLTEEEGDAWITKAYIESLG